MLIGSCFANEIGTILKDYRFDITTNPFGTLYNPVSIANSIERMESRREFALTEVIDISKHQTTYADENSTYTGNGLFCTFSHHSSFAKANAAEFLEHCNKSLHNASLQFAQADTIIITLGTSWVFRHNKQDNIVSNCHKINPKEFTRELLPMEEIARILGAIVERHPHKRFIFTVSPIRHLKDGAHGNHISKANLLMAIDEIMRKNPQNTSYFPSYEIVLDELRDYRFYAEDMVHPSPTAVQYIFERFKDNYIDPDSYQLMQQNLKQTKLEQHKKREW